MELTKPPQLCLFRSRGILFTQKLIDLLSEKQKCHTHLQEVELDGFQHKKKKNPNETCSHGWMRWKKQLFVDERVGIPSSLEYILDNVQVVIRRAVCGIKMACILQTMNPSLSWRFEILQAPSEIWQCSESMDRNVKWNKRIVWNTLDSKSDTPMK